ncbi:hypothetical protein VB715_06760 [Crocosphaera sp. UHCC 0190]|uniref:hypothetical protein n=1 Tax=Crocosphaera sp. UHCC 0190 TaxID=3110246 RepID=UPI002B21AE85|nr:hypothetical protein [Crocosphaera sp. UHCC 0190]MEA5509460.1 hypothetical protein [Crocosphaera sp. UHCC 0190]
MIQKPSDFELLGHDCPLGRYPAPVVPIGRKNNQLVAVYLDSATSEPAFLSIDENSVFVRYEGNFKESLFNFDCSKEKLFAISETQVMRYMSSKESDFFKSLLKDEKFSEDDPFFRFSLAKPTKDSQVIDAESKKCDNFLINGGYSEEIRAKFFTKSDNFLVYFVNFLVYFVKWIWDKLSSIWPKDPPENTPSENEGLNLNSPGEIIMTAIRNERVGVLVVHGIGEQRKFETVEEIVRDVATALKADKTLKVRIIVNEQNTGAYAASQQTWQADDDKEPVIIEIRDDQNNLTQLAFSEVWWADLGERTSLQTQMTFWGWGLSLWSRKQYADINLATSDQMSPPQDINGNKPQMDFNGRLRFFWVSLVILLVLPVLSFLSVILRKVLGFDLRPDILVQYLGDIKLYQQGRRQGKGPLVDLGQRPRLSIRRRMVKGLVEMSLRNYDRWYVLSHSLGTIVAFNGLMETEEALPNYLNEDLWRRWQYVSPTKAKKDLTDDDINNMLPSRPAWLNNNDIVSRSDLFRNLQGFMTYGSPLSKFGVVWPAIVPVNKDNSVFNSKFEWLNVYDPTDPVAGRTALFNFKTIGDKQQPQEIAYKAEAIHLLSHVEYLNYKPGRKTPLVKQLGYWLLTGEAFQPAPKSLGWPTPFIVQVYNNVRLLIWVVSAVVISWLLTFFVRFALPDFIEETLNNVPYVDFSNPFFYIVLSAIIVFIFGIIMRLFKITFN